MWFLLVHLHHLMCRRIGRATPSVCATISHCRLDELSFGVIHVDPTVPAGDRAFSTPTCSSSHRMSSARCRVAGDHHNAAVRNLSNKLIGRMWWCCTTTRTGTSTPPGTNPRRATNSSLLDTDSRGMSTWPPGRAGCIRARFVTAVPAGSSATPSPTAFTPRCPAPEWAAAHRAACRDGRNRPCNAVLGATLSRLSGADGSPRPPPRACGVGRRPLAVGHTSPRMCSLCASLEPRPSRKRSGPKKTAGVVPPEQ